MPCHTNGGRTKERMAGERSGRTAGTGNAGNVETVAGCDRKWSPRGGVQMLGYLAAEVENGWDLQFHCVGDGKEKGNGKFHNSKYSYK